MSPPTLDFDKLRTPPSHGDTLVMPAPGRWLAAARENHESLAAAKTPLLDSTLGAWRRRTRERLVGRDDSLVFVTGHQPDFIHPGVWAKHAVAMRAARAALGVALNLVVDSDAPKRTALTVPMFDGGRLVLRPIPFAELRPGFTFEQIPRQNREAVERFRDAVRLAIGERYDDSQMPTYFEAALCADAGKDWVDQALSGRQAVERRLGVSIDDRRVSDAWCSPMLIDILVNAERFAECYNRALADYRARYRVRGSQRPIPDLHRDANVCEAPAWIYRADEPRRRLFVAPDGGDLRLFADRAEVGVLPERHLRSCSQLKAVLTDLADWRIRPRALTLTIWARLLLADLFIHGIGGAKYDRISDSIIADYYGLAPPHMACVSATLHLGLSHNPQAPDDMLRRRRELRDLRFNPQRYACKGAGGDALLARRADAVRQAETLRRNRPGDRSARRAAFDRIRAINAELLAAMPDREPAFRARLAEAEDAAREALVATNREWFFGLYDRARLDGLLASLPREDEFRV